MKISGQPMKVLDTLMKIIRHKKLKHQNPNTKEYSYLISY